ncbi:hypothetical protein PMAYCL1PPCAC_26449, partial [Pristionchus mayeri]
NIGQKRRLIPSDPLSSSHRILLLTADIQCDVPHCHSPRNTRRQSLLPCCIPSRSCSPSVS